MNLSERVIVKLLAAFDRCMDFVTLGRWSRVCGEMRVYRIKER